MLVGVLVEVVGALAHAEQPGCDQLPLLAPRKESITVSWRFEKLF